MTENGRKVLEVMVELEQKDSKTDNQWFEASRITKHYIERFGDLEGRAKPVMTISGFLTHLKRIGLVERQVSTDKMFAWWRRTPKGKEAL
jgi:hypothetical protein